jgi:hypothetical protein
MDLTSKLSAFIRQGLPIVFVGGIPNTESDASDGQLPEKSALNPLQNILANGNVHIASDARQVAQILELSVSPNLHFNGASLPFIEKRIGELHFFFLRNPNDVAKQTSVECDVTGVPELWDPWTGTIRPLAHFERNGDEIRVPIDIDPYGSVLLVFDPGGIQSEVPVEMPAPADPLLQMTVGQNGWDFHGVGIGPGSLPEIVDTKMSSLEDWTMIDGLKNFSGRGQYTTTFTLPASLLDNQSRILLDLGDVGDVAEISINGMSGPDLLMRPYRADVTPLLHVGVNKLQITVVNVLFNALSAQGRSANYVPEATNTVNGLIPSGLIGPVRLERTKVN